MNTMPEETEIDRVLDALRTKGFAEFRRGAEAYLIQPESNKGWDYISVWQTSPAAVCLCRAEYDLFGGIDAETVRELMEQPCIGGESLLRLCARGEIEWI